MLANLMASSRIPLVLDADALNLLALHPGALLQVPKNSILTPHPGEYRRLFGEDPDDYSRVLRMRDLAMQYGLTLVLKGSHTAVAGPDGSVWFNTTGNPGMATGGSGDVLTGIITGLYAQGYDSFTAARLGVYLHGLAGDLACDQTGQQALIARDVIDSLGEACKEISKLNI
jgi:NAD(P)H-hydrate epimerase